MQAVLNFSQEEKQKLLAFLKKEAKQQEKKTEFEENHGTIDDCTITLFSSGKLLIQGNNAQLVKEKILLQLNIEDELVLGIDETGRGENFGPLVIVGVLGFKNKLRELRDSKKINEHSKKKEIVLKNSLATFAISISASEIDSLRATGKNLNVIEAEAMDAIISSAKKTKKIFKIVVDGNPLPLKETGVEFLPKADDLNPVVGAASVLAKAIREESKDKAKRQSWKN
jgi:ribonuclease HII